MRTFSGKELNDIREFCKSKINENLTGEFDWGISSKIRISYDDAKNRFLATYHQFQRHDDEFLVVFE